MLPKSFKPKKNFELIRIGSDNDGGYLVDKNSILDTKNFIAMGLGDDWCFEKDFLKLNNCNIFCFDRKINKNFWKKNILKCFEKFILRKINYKKFRKNIIDNLECRNIFKKNIYFFEGFIAKDKTSKTLKDIISENNLKEKIFLKIDIEGSEYRILDELIEYQNIIVGMVIEFHNVDINLHKIENFIKNFSLSLIHIHPNNADSISKDNIPISIELSFARNPKIINDNIQLPHPLDCKSRDQNEDHKLEFMK